MNILFILPSYLPEMGGVQRQAHLLGGTLVRRGHNVTILTRKVPGEAGQETMDGIEVRRRFPASSPRRLYSAAMILSTAAFLVRRGRTFDVIHCFRLSVHNLAVAALRPVFGWRYIAAMSGGGPSGDLAPVPDGVRRRLLRAACRRADAVLALSTAMRDEMIRFGFPADRIRIVPNAVDADLFSCPHRTYDRTDRWLFVGRLAPEKNLPALLEVVARPENTRARLTLVGDGPLRGALERRVTELGIDRRVTFAGPADDPAPFYCSHDLFVLPSLAEGMPTVLLEAMAAGMPCVCTPVGGALDIIRSGSNGMLAGDVSAEALASAVRAAVNASPAQRAAWGERARRLVQERFDLPRVGDLFEQLYSAPDPLAVPPRP